MADPPPTRMIYLDNHATTRCDPRVVEAMLPWMSEHYGNAGSVVHAFGEAAREAVENAREAIAAAIGAEPTEIVFTSGATESNNLAIRGVVERPRRRGDHLVSVATEHRAVLDPLERLSRRGHAVTLLDVEPIGSERCGWLDPAKVAAAVTDETSLVSVMLANNEIGIVQPLRAIAEATHAGGAVLHTDATQAVGKISVDVNDLGVDLMSFTAHKLYGPKGVGALYVRRRQPVVRLDPQVTGGGQERGLRSGTLNVPGIVGFAHAIKLCQAEREAESERLRGLRDSLFERFRQAVPGLRLIGPALDTHADGGGGPLRLTHNLNVAIDGVDGEALMLRMPEVAVSSGAACSSADPEPSHVLRAIGMTEDEARCTLRFGLGRFTTEPEIEQAAARVAVAVEAVRDLAG